MLPTTQEEMSLQTETFLPQRHVSTIDDVW